MTYGIVPLRVKLYPIKTHKELDRYISKLGPIKGFRSETILKIHTTLRKVLTNFKDNPEEVQAVYEKIISALCYMHPGGTRLSRKELINEGDLKILRKTKRDIKQKTMEFLKALELAHEPWFHTHWNTQRDEYDPIFNAKSGEQYIQKIREQLGEVEGK